MVFSTYKFIFLFFPCVFILFILSVQSDRIVIAKWILVISSLVFYFIGSGSFFPFFIGSIIFNYLIGKCLGFVRHGDRKITSRCLLILGILGNCALLGYYKYTDFFIFNLNFLFSMEIPYKHIVLPIGISFFTFQLIAYLVDSYRGETTEYNMLNYLLFITFFPQLIVGPIVHHKDVVPQYSDRETLIPNYKKISEGIFLFFIGCAKKLMMADPLSEWAQNAFDHAQSLNMYESWNASLSYTLSYYFDLSGYADMAIGLGLIFGITLPINFDSPYKSRNFAEYWRKWHMTLSRFLGDYIFRSVFKKGKGSKNFYFAVFITFLVSGFWHGAGWNFVVWGILNGLFVMAAHFMTRKKWKLPFVLAWFLTFLGIVITRILFVSNSLDDAFYVLATLFDFGTFSFSGKYLPVKGPFYILTGLMIVLFLPNSNQLREKFKPNCKYAIIISCLIVISILNMSNVRGFLYFQF